MRKYFIFAGAMVLLAGVQSIRGCTAKDAGDLSGEVASVWDADSFRVELPEPIEVRMEEEPGASEDRPKYRVIVPDKRGEVRVRLQGLEAPERGQVCTRPASVSVPILRGVRVPFKCGELARRELIEILGGETTGREGKKGAGGRVVCDVRAFDHRWGRPVAVCYAGVGASHGPGVDIAGELIRRGYGRAYTRYSRRYEGIERQAREAGMGLYAPGVEWEDPGEYRKARANGRGQGGKGKTTPKGDAVQGDGGVR